MTDHTFGRFCRTCRAAGLDTGLATEVAALDARVHRLAGRYKAAIQDLDAPGWPRSPSQRWRGALPLPDWTEAP